MGFDIRLQFFDASLDSLSESLIAMWLEQQWRRFSFLKNPRRLALDKNPQLLYSSCRSSLINDDDLSRHKDGRVAVVLEDAKQDEEKADEVVVVVVEDTTVVSRGVMAILCNKKTDRENEVGLFCDISPSGVSKIGW